MPTWKKFHVIAFHMREMLMSNNSTLDYCRELLASESNHKKWQCRNVISRAYYNVFYIADKKLRIDLGWRETTSKGGVHNKLYSRLNGYPDDVISKEKELELAALQKNISDLKKLRTNADYKLQLNIERKVAEFSIVESETISEKINSL